MNTTIRLLIIVTASLIFVGCESHREAAPCIGSGYEAIQTRDIMQANIYRAALPELLKLSPDQVRVDAGSGVADVTITGVHSNAERQKIQTAIDSLNAQNPKCDPVRVRFE